MSDRDPAEMHRVRGPAGRSYAKLDPSGVLSVVCNGKGLSVRMDAGELRKFALCAWAVADTLDERERDASDAALVELARAIS